MNFLFFDTETNGLPKSYGASYSDLDNWPRVAQLAWILSDDQGEVLASGQDLVKPDGWEIPKEDFFIEHGMSTERNIEHGIPILDVLEPFMAAKQQADFLVAHNMSYDHPITWAEILRAGLQPRTGLVKICTMRRSTKYCNIPGKRGPKWPKLEELHEILFGKGFEGAHDAMADITATKDCFFELVRRGVIKPELITNTGVRA